MMIELGLGFGIFVERGVEGTYEIGFVDVVDDGGAAEEGEDDDDDRQPERWSPGRWPASAEFFSVH